MTKDVSRRNFVALAGAAAAVAACSESSTEQKGSAMLRSEPLGPPPNHGLSTAERRPTGAPTSLVFDPKFLSIVYFRFGRVAGDRKLLAYHGYESIPSGASSTDIQKIAEAALLEAKRATPGRWKRNYDPTAGQQRREENLEKFDFNQQNKVFILIDHDENEIKFDNRPDKNVTPRKMSNLVRFTSLLSQQDQVEIDYNAIAQPNNSFLNAKLFQTLSDQLENRKLLVIENWYTDLNGNPITGNPKLRYSMNINLLIATDNDKWIPLIIDPDTGNGMGNNP